MEVYVSTIRYQDREFVLRKLIQIPLRRDQDGDWVIENELTGATIFSPRLSDCLDAYAADFSYLWDRLVALGLAEDDDPEEVWVKEKLQDLVDHIVTMRDYMPNVALS